MAKAAVRRFLVVSPLGSHDETLAMLKNRYSDSAYVLCNRNPAPVEMTSLQANKAIALKWLTEKNGAKNGGPLAIGG